MWALLTRGLVPEVGVAGGGELPCIGTRSSTQVLRKNSTASVLHYLPFQLIRKILEPESVMVLIFIMMHISYRLRLYPPTF